MWSYTVKPMAVEGTTCVGSGSWGQVVCGIGPWGQRRHALGRGVSDKSWHQESSEVTERNGSGLPVPAEQC